MDAVVQSRKDRMGPHEESWNMEVHLVAMAARVAHMKILGIDLPLCAIKIFKTLWPEVECPLHIKDLCKWLNACDDRLDEWRESAARAGADTALMFILSWYEEIDFDALTTIRIGSKVLDDPEVKKRRQARAYAMAQYAPWQTFIPDPEEKVDEEGDDEEIDEEIIADEPPSNQPTSGASTSGTAGID